MKINLKELAIFSVLGALMYVSKMVMEFLPNVHLLATLIVAMTVVFRQKALYPIYVFVFLTGLLNGFNLWWLPYLYIWTVLWGVAMLLPKKMPPWVAAIAYCLIAGLHGLAYGTLYAPAQALMFHLNFEQTVAWIVAGLPWDILHGISNLVCGVLILPLVAALRQAQRLTR
ncbi:MAG: hypothetical protein IJE00_07560 [Clostridia bacterium]|nr:hypothetical protein [Clostridia bacterium]